LKAQKYRNELAADDIIIPAKKPSIEEEEEEEEEDGSGSTDQVVLHQLDDLNARYEKICALLLERLQSVAKDCDPAIHNSHPDIKVGVIRHP
jgi:hypothetical protein